MAQQGDVTAVSQYPEPPHFYKLYKDGPQSGPPPPPPIQGEFTVFGAPFNLVRGRQQRSADAMPMLPFLPI